MSFVVRFSDRRLGPTNRDLDGSSATIADFGQRDPQFACGDDGVTSRRSCSRCRGTSSSFGFEMNEADYPGAGVSFSVAQLPGNPQGDIKWQLDAASAYLSGASGGVAVTPDFRSVAIDQELSPAAAAGAPRPGPEHVKGSIVCA